MRKRFVALLCALMLALGCAACCAEAVYQLGDTMEDFPVALVDGTTTTLYEMLEGKDAVLLNFWASWCSPCRMEFPALYAAWAGMSDEIGALALSTERADTAEAIVQFAADNGITGLPMGRDEGNVYSRFGVNSIPLSVMVDSSRTICFIHTGAIFDPSDFERLFSAFTAEDDAGPVLLTEIPPFPLPEAADAQALATALGLQDSLRAENVEGLWPMLPAQEGVSASNGIRGGTIAALTVAGDAKAGDALVYEYQLGGGEVFDNLTVYLNDAPVNLHTGSFDAWTQGAVRMEQDGAFRAEFAFTNSTADSGVCCNLRGVRLLTGDEAAACAQAAAYPQALAGTAVQCEAADGSVKVASLCVGGEPVAALDVYRVAFAGGDSADFRILLGDACSPQFGAVLIQAGAEQTAYSLGNLPCDERGFLVTADLTGAAEAAYLDVYHSCFEPAGQQVIIARTQEIVDALLAELTMIGVQYGVISGQDAQSACLMTAKGEVIATLAQEEQPAAQEETDGEREYAVLCVDGTGSPVAGVKIQLCSGDLCMLLTTDESGRASHTAPAGSFEAHVLKAPEGYEGTDKVFTLPQEGGEVVILLKKK